MAEELGEVRVNIEEEGAEEAAGTIGDAVGGDGAGGGGGTVGGLLGGIAGKLAAILGFVTFLASLKPIQELLSGLQRLFSVAILPLVSLLTTFLRPVLQKLLQFIAQLDFENIVASLLANLQRVFNNSIDQLGNEISSSIPGVENETVSSGLREGITGGLSTVGGAGTGFGAAFGPLASLSFDFLTEQSRSSMDENATSTVNREGVYNGVGGE